MAELCCRAPTQGATWGAPSIAPMSPARRLGASSPIIIQRIGNPRVMQRLAAFRVRAQTQDENRETVGTKDKPINTRFENLTKGSNGALYSEATQPPTPSHPQLPHDLITFLASLGTAETAYLTYEKLFGGPLTCPFGGSCNDVLDSSYGTLLGVPLSVYGFVSYASVVLLAQISKTETKRGILEDNVRWLLLALTSVMAGVSGFLLYVIKFELDSAFCTYCIASAVLTWLLLFLTFKGFSGGEVRRAVVPQLGLLAATVVGLSIAFGDPSVDEIDLPPLEPEVTTVSTPIEVRLAKHLSAVGAKMYGAFWCSHCYDQKQAFGQEASKYLPYVECYPEGYRRGVKIAKSCEDAKIEGFPTWVINGELRPGEQDLVELARLTGFDPSKSK